MSKFMLWKNDGLSEVMEIEGRQEWALRELMKAGADARMRLTPPQLAMLVRNLGSHDAGRYPIPEDADRCERYGCSYREYRAVVFYAYRAALSLLVETAPRSRLDLHDLLETLMAWPGALPPDLQAIVASVIGAQVADSITGQPFKRRALVARGGAR